MVELALTPDIRWTVDPAAVAAAGYTALGATAGADPSAWDAAGLRCHEVLGLLVGADQERAVRKAEALAETAVALGAPWVLATFLDPFELRVAVACARALRAAGVGMAVEFSPLGPLATISDGLRVVDAVGGGLVVDTWHFCRGASTWDELARLPLDQLAYVQFTDAPPPASADGMRETMDRRVLPGDGELELARFASTLLDRGWDGVVSVEVLSTSIPMADVVSRGYEASAAYWKV